MNNKKVKEKTIRFKDYPEFRPNLTPRQIFLLGSFGGTYWRPITSKVTKKSYKNKHKEFPKSWWKGIPNKWLTSPVCDLSINNYGVKSGTSLRFWEKKGWMNKQDPYGWVQWYCRFYKGRRTPDDKRQIKRWLAFSGPKGRFKRRLVNMIKNKKTKYNDYKISPVIRQGLQHWAYRLVPSDVRKKPVKKRNFGKKWSLKYKRSINCKRPKGFSQKQYCKRKRKFGKKTFLYNPNNPKTSFDVYINKNPKDTIPIKYTTIKDVKDTIRKLERLYKAKKYPHTRIWKVGMILKVRLEAMVKHTGKKKTHFKHSKNYFHFLGQRTTKKEPERRKMVFKFNKTYRKVNKVKRRRKFGSNSSEKFDNNKKELEKKINTRGDGNKENCKINENSVKYFCRHQKYYKNYKIRAEKILEYNFEKCKYTGDNFEDWFEEFKNDINDRLSTKIEMKNEYEKYKLDSEDVLEPDANLQVNQMAVQDDKTKFKDLLKEWEKIQRNQHNLRKLFVFDKTKIFEKKIKKYKDEILKIKDEDHRKLFADKVNIILKLINPDIKKTINKNGDECTDGECMTMLFGKKRKRKRKVKRKRKRKKVKRKRRKRKK